MTSGRVRVAIIGVGGMGRAHIRQMAKQQSTTAIEVVCDISPDSYAAASQTFREAGIAPPPNEPNLQRMLERYRGELDAALIVTPHACHFEHASACMEAGLDVLLEKPMVMNAGEARRLIAVRDETGKKLVIAFQSSLSPQIRTAARMIRSGEIGDLLSISGVVWQNWGPNTADTWRQEIAVSGGGFLFDTGAHLLNTVTDLAGQDFVEVAAWLDCRNRPVDVLAGVMGRLKSGALVTLHGSGEAIPSCSSDVRVFCTQAILRTGVWGERLQIQRNGSKRLMPLRVPKSLGVWQQFLAVRAGTLANPSPPEVGLRMARLWDAVRASAAQHGQPVHCS